MLSLFGNGFKGLAESKWAGIAGSVFRAVGIDYRSTPGLIKVHQKLTKNSGETVDELCMASVPVSDGSTLWFSSESGKIWREVNGTWTLLYELAIGTYDFLTAHATSNTRAFRATTSDDPEATTGKYPFFSTSTAAPVRPGERLYTLQPSKIDEWELSTAYSLSTASHLQAFSFSAQTSTARVWFMRPDGDAFFIASDDDIYQYALGDTWDISSASYETKTYAPSETTDIQGMWFSDDGEKMYLLGGVSPGVVYQYTLGTAWDISTATYDTVSFTQAQIIGDISPSLSFSPNGEKMYLFTLNGIALQYALSTAWDLDTCTFEKKVRLTAAQTITSMSLPDMEVDILAVAGGGSGGTSSGNRGGGGGGGGEVKTGSFSISSAGAYQVVVGGGGQGSGTAGIQGAGGDSYFGTPIFRTLVVGGGGGGGQHTSGGGGGGGEVLEYNPIWLPTENTITIGSGGGAFTNGSNSSLNDIVALGGGSGGDTTNKAGSLGTGGGSAGDRMPGMPANGDIGKRGGRGQTTGGDSGGGGGGNSGNGSNGATDVGGNGGSGQASTITGSSVSYGGGGGGASGGGTGGAGTGGGGNGQGAGAATSGTANTGGGGGGGAVPGSGGSGVVIIRFPTAAITDISTTGSPTITTDGADTIYTFTASGTFNFTYVTYGAQLYARGGGVGGNGGSIMSISDAVFSGGSVGGTGGGGGSLYLDSSAFTGSIAGGKGSFNGGDGVIAGNTGTDNSGGGGGGGASANGSNSNGTTGGNGGAGVVSTISGSSITYGQGGGGGGLNVGVPTGVGTAGTGRGGQGAQISGSPTDGASGVVIISYLTGLLEATGGNISTVGNRTVHTFTSDGTFEITGINFQIDLKEYGAFFHPTTGSVFLSFDNVLSADKDGLDISGTRITEFGLASALQTDTKILSAKEFTTFSPAVETLGTGDEIPIPHIFFSTPYLLLRIPTENIADVDGFITAAGLYSNGHTEHHPMAIQNLSLFVGDAHNLAEIDTNGTFVQETPLNLPRGEVIQALYPFDTDLLIGSKAIIGGWVRRWDTDSDSWSAQDDVYDEGGVTAFLGDDNYVYPITGPFGRVYFYDGEKMQPYVQIPGEWGPSKKAVVHCNAVGFWMNLPIFGLSNSTGNPQLQGIYGLGSFGRGFDKTLSLDFPISEDTFEGITIGAILVKGADLMVAWKTASAVGVDKLNWNAKYASAYFETRILNEISTSKGIANARHIRKTLKEVAVPYAELPTDTGITIAYKKKNESSYTNLEAGKDQTDDQKLYFRQTVPAMAAPQLRATFTVNENSAPAIEDVLVDIIPAE
jgi:hypothetical protein